MKYLKTTALLHLFAFTMNCLAQNVGWEIIDSGTDKNLNSIYFYDHQFGIACGDSSILIKSIDGGKTWQSLPSPTIIDQNDCFMFSRECFITVGNSGIGTFYGIDSLFIWDLSEFGLDIYSVAFMRNTNYSPGVFGASSQSIFICWTNYCSATLGDVYGGSQGGFWGAQMLNFDLGFVAGENSISQPILGRTTNSGSTWDYISFYLDGNEGRATGVVFTDSLIGYISASVWDGRGAICKSNNNGDTWTTQFFNYPLRSIEFPIIGLSQVGYCVGDSGLILKTIDAGETWNYQITGLKENLNKVFFVDNNFGFAVGDNGLILRTETGGGPVSDINNDDLLSFNFELMQNYPNPFNPTTTISWQSPVSSHQTLKIYDVLGNEIATLVDEYKPVGKYEIQFNATELSSGIYFYQLHTGEFIQTKKMILMK